MGNMRGKEIPAIEVEELQENWDSRGRMEMEDRELGLKGEESYTGQGLHSG